MSVDINTEQLSEDYCLLTAELMREHSAIVEEMDATFTACAAWASVADTIDSLRHRNRLRDKVEWVQARSEAVSSIRSEIESCLAMIRSLLSAMGM
ncbi:uncharacterized protein SAPINGB_P001836 [Magnusiomyces paraingens]|uniref:Uncharacterized protein n=1 Tax=Magnusiomyces paraingens TaxID=2606893 RepID=A0A5E8BGH3_9ASCO|nr:uncharacterized protein SAPINGB_P001836 [Saprochaete ingens]VVT48555.1 unnamed protein product [Saprochaete ingens]